MVANKNFTAIYSWYTVLKPWHDNATPAPNIRTNSWKESRDRSVGSVANY